MLFAGEAVHEEHGEEEQGPDHLHGAPPQQGPDHTHGPAVQKHQVYKKTFRSFIYWIKQMFRSKALSLIGSPNPKEAKVPTYIRWY